MSFTLNDARKILNKKDVSVLDLQKLLDERPNLFVCDDDTSIKFNNLTESLLRNKKVSDEECKELDDLFYAHGIESYDVGSEEGVKRYLEEDLNLDEIKTNVKILVKELTQDRKASRKKCLNTVINLCRELDLADEQTTCSQKLISASVNHD